MTRVLTNHNAIFIIMACFAHYIVLNLTGLFGMIPIPGLTGNESLWLINVILAITVIGLMINCAINHDHDRPISYVISFAVLGSIPPYVYYSLWNTEWEIILPFSWVIRFWWDITFGLFL